ncbi:MAG: putative DNA-binding domain-containing protein [Rhodocyclaceae bacterium]|nr:putative DNA-binding domain-containing protein [Rhodocyclaceae bacterium]
MGLIELQRRMQAAITTDAEPPPLLGDGRGLAAYRHAWRARMIEALRSNYPILHRVLGDADFEALAGGYLAAHPSRFRSIRWFGDALEAYLREQPEAAGHPAVADMAAFEWAVCLAFDGPDATLLEPATLAGLGPKDWARLRLALHPTARLLDLAWSVAPIWRELSEHDDPDHRAPPPEPLDHSVLVWRRGRQPHWRSLEPLEASLLKAVDSGMDFAALCALAGQIVGPDVAPATVLGFLGPWLADGLLVDGEAA